MDEQAKGRFSVWWNRLTSRAQGALIIAVVVVFLIAVGALVGDSPDDSPDSSVSSVSSGEYDAFMMCKSFVTDTLKAPATAKWRDPLGDQVSYSGSGDGPYVVVASVDSQNGFGALVRSPYSCTVVHDPAAKTWRLVSLTM